MADYVATSQGRIGYGLPQPYNAMTAYKKRDVVQYQGGCYVVLLDGVVGIVPADDGVNYRLMCERGEAGEGNAQWFTGTAVSGREAGIVAGVVGSKEGDMYLNSGTSDLYRASASDTWDWVMNIGEAVNVAADKVPTRDGGSVQDALDDLSARTAADIPAGDEGESVLTVLDEHTAAIVDLEARTAADIPAGDEGESLQAVLDEHTAAIVGLEAKTAVDIPTDEADVSVQDALDGKLPSASVVNNLTTPSADEGYALDARQGKVLNIELGKKLEHTLLYTNASPISAFPAQTLALALPDYTSVLVEMYANATTVGYRPRYQLAIGSELTCVQILGDGQQWSRFLSTSASGVVFGDGRVRAYNTAGDGTINNITMVPYRIWGVKGV